MRQDEPIRLPWPVFSFVKENFPKDEELFQKALHLLKKAQGGFLHLHVL